MLFKFSDEQIIELKTICETVFKQPFSFDEARRMSLDLLDLYLALSDLARENPEKFEIVQGFLKQSAATST